MKPVKLPKPEKEKKVKDPKPIKIHPAPIYSTTPVVAHIDDCFTIGGDPEGECFSVSSGEPDCFWINRGEEPEPKLPFPPDVPFDPLGFIEIKCIQAHGLNELVVIAKYQETDISPIEDVIAKVNYSPSVIGGIGKLAGVSYVNLLSSYDIDYDSVTRLDGFDVLTTHSNLCIVVGTRVVWVEGMFFNVIGDTDEFVSILGIPSDNPYSKENTYPKDTTFIEELESNTTVVSGYSTYTETIDDSCIDTPVIGSPCGGIYCSYPISHNSWTRNHYSKKTYNIINGEEHGSGEPYSFNHTAPFDGISGQCEGEPEEEDPNLVTCEYSGTMITSSGDTIEMQREGIITVLDSGEVCFDASPVYSYIESEIKKYKYAGRSGTCPCGWDMQYVRTCREEVVTIDFENKIETDFDTSERIFKLLVSDDVVAGLNENIGFVWAEKSGSRKGIESVSGSEDATVVDAIMLKADGTDKVTQVNLLPTLLP